MPTNALKGLYALWKEWDNRSENTWNLKNQVLSKANKTCPSLSNKSSFLRPPPIYSPSYPSCSILPPTSEYQVEYIFVLPSFFFFCLFIYQHLHSTRSTDVGKIKVDPLMSCRPIYLMWPDIEDIFPTVTSGSSYHLFTMCTLFWISSDGWLNSGLWPCSRGQCTRDFLFLPLCFSWAH